MRIAASMVGSMKSYKNGDKSARGNYNWGQNA